MEEIGVILFVLFWIVSGIFGHYNKVREQKARERQALEGPPAEDDPFAYRDEEEGSDAAAASFAQEQAPSRPSPSPQSTPSSLPQTPEEALRRLFMGQGFEAAPPPPQPVRPAQSAPPPRPAPRVVRAQPVESQPESGSASAVRTAQFDRLDKTRQLREQRAEKVETAKADRSRAGIEAREKSQAQEEQFRLRALAKEKGERRRLEEVRSSYRGLADSERAKHSRSASAPLRAKLSRANLREAVLLHEMLLPPLALRNRTGVRRAR